MMQFFCLLLNFGRWDPLLALLERGIVHLLEHLAFERDLAVQKELVAVTSALMKSGTRDAGRPGDHLPFPPLPRIAGSDVSNM